MAAIIIDTTAPVNRMAELNDRISNTLSAHNGKWSFEYKVFRENTASRPLDNNGNPVIDPNPANAFLHTLQFSHYPGDIFCLTKGSGTVLQGDFDSMLQTKLQSLWTIRQTYKGEGQSYSINNDEYTIRIANLNLMGSYKGLAMEIHYNKESEDPLANINQLLESIGVSNKATKTVQGRLNVAWQYAAILTN